MVFWETPAELFFLDRKTRVETIPTADSYMQSVSTKKYGSHGRVAYILTAETGLYYSGDDRFELKSPQLLARQSSPEINPWRLTANIARSSKRGEEILLSGNVYAFQGREEWQERILYR